METTTTTKILYTLLGFAGSWVLPWTIRKTMTCFCKKKQTNEKQTRTYDLYLKEHKNKSLLSTILFAGDEDIYKKLYQDLQKLPENKDISIYVETFGGSALWTELICNKIKNRTGKVSVYINTYGLSAGTCLALAADHLYMTNDAALSAIDPQESILRHMYLPVKDIAGLVSDFKKNAVEIYEKRKEIAVEKTFDLLNDKYNSRQKQVIVKKMFQDPVDHATLFFVNDLKRIGVDVEPFE